MAGRISGRRCLVTGAAQGLGRVFCAALAREGGVVAGLDIEDLSGTAEAVAEARTLAGADDGVERRGDRPGEATQSDPGDAAAEGGFVPVIADVTSPESVTRALALVDERLGGLDILVNNAGVYPVLKFEDTSYQRWRHVMAVNLDGTFLVTQAALPALRRSSSGRIVNIASAVVWLGPPGMVAYTASKAGVVGFTRALASELGPSGITVNAITPGMIPTDTAIRTGVTADLERVVASQAVPRAEQPEDLISTLLFLVDEGSAFVTGAAINVDGGFAKH
jgi:3-oxoacyl-[acyl-carrier protein] reductase